MDPDNVNTGLSIGWKLTAILATLGGWLSAASGAVAVAFYRLRKLENQVSIDSQRDTRRLYSEDGLPIYMMRSECQMRSEECRKQTDQQMEQIREALHDVDQKQEERFQVLLNAILGGKKKV